MKAGTPGRRVTLKVLALGGLAATGLLTVSACNDKEAAKGDDGEKAKSGAADAKSCDATPDAESNKLRKTLQYKEAATDAKKPCETCVQYEAGKYGDCGGCKLFTGPVQPKGGCLSWAPKS